MWYMVSQLLILAFAHPQQPTLVLLRRGNKNPKEETCQQERTNYGKKRKKINVLNARLKDLQIVQLFVTQGQKKQRKSFGFLQLLWIGRRREGPNKDLFSTLPQIILKNMVVQSCKRVVIIWKTMQCYLSMQQYLYALAQFCAENLVPCSKNL